MTTKPYETSEGSPPINPVERLATLVGDDLQAVDRVIHSRMTSQTHAHPASRPRISWIPAASACAP